MKGTTNKDKVLVIVDTITMCPRAQNHNWAVVQLKYSAGTLAEYYLAKMVNGKVHHLLCHLRADEVYRYNA